MVSGRTLSEQDTCRRTEEARLTQRLYYEGTARAGVSPYVRLDYVMEPRFVP